MTNIRFCGSNAGSNGKGYALIVLNIIIFIIILQTHHATMPVIYLIKCMLVSVMYGPDVSLLIFLGIAYSYNMIGMGIPKWFLNVYLDNSSCLNMADMTII